MAATPDHYCVLDDVNNLVTQVPYTPTSKPNATQVTQMIDDVGNDMDTVMRNIGYQVPVVTGALGLKWLRKTCALGVAGLAQASRDAGVSTAVGGGTADRKNIFQQMYEDRMSALADPQDPTELPDAPRTAEQLQKQPENVLRSFVQTIPSDDPNYDPDNPEVERYQAL